MEVPLNQFPTSRSSSWNNSQTVAAWKLCFRPLCILFCWNGNVFGVAVRHSWRRLEVIIVDDIVAPYNGYCLVNNRVNWISNVTRFKKKEICRKLNSEFSFDFIKNVGFHFKYSSLKRFLCRNLSVLFIIRDLWRQGNQQILSTK